MWLIISILDGFQSPLFKKPKTLINITLTYLWTSYVYFQLQVSLIFVSLAM